jgi:hypothetical protein
MYLKTHDAPYAFIPLIHEKIIAGEAVNQLTHLIWTNMAHYHFHKKSPRDHNFYSSNYLKPSSYFCVIYFNIIPHFRQGVELRLIALLNSVWFPVKGKVS